MSLRDKLRDLPTDSGVYIYMDGDGKVLYVGLSLIHISEPTRP